MTSLRRKTTVTLGATLAGLVIVLFLISQVVISNSFDQLERDELKKDVQNAKGSLYGDMEELEKKRQTGQCGMKHTTSFLTRTAAI